MLRRLLGVPEGAIFEKVLAKKLRTFQAEHGLPDVAIAGSATIAALNRGSAFYERLIQLNMERARVLPGPLTRIVLVDAVTARLWLYNTGQMISVGRRVGKECVSPCCIWCLMYHKNKKNHVQLYIKHH